MKKWLIFLFVLFLSILGVCIFLITSRSAKSTEILETAHTQVATDNAPKAPENTPVIPESVDESLVEEFPVADASSRLIVAAVPSDNTLELGTIDTETGEYSKITWFKFSDNMINDSVSISLSDKTLCLFLIRAKYYGVSIFSDDLEKIACTLQFPSGETHAGWLNLSKTEGKNISYVDVTEKLGEQSGSSFSETTVNYYGIGFSEDGNFIYSDSSIYYPKDDASYFSAPMENLNKDYVTQVSLQSPEVLASGSGIDWENLSSFVDDRTIVLTEETGRSLKKYNVVFYNTDTGEKSSIIPEVEERNNYCGVVSPDKTKLAFISMVGAESRLFVTTLDGGEPLELTTSVPMAWVIHSEGGRLGYERMLETGYVPLEWK